MLGAILAGGRSSRFGADKAAAPIDGMPLLDHVAAALGPQVAMLAVCGRDWPGLPTIADQPRADLGPLGGLCGALAHAADHGFDAVLTAGCDVLPVPADLAARLAPGPAYVEGQPLFALWPSRLAGPLRAHMERGEVRSLYGWIAVSGARSVVIPDTLFNINTPADLARFHDAWNIAPDALWEFRQPCDKDRT